jgi:hypothetical protein
MTERRCSETFQKFGKTAGNAYIQDIIAYVIRRLPPASDRMHPDESTT